MSGLPPEVGFTLPDHVVIERLRAAWVTLRRNPGMIGEPLGRYGESFVAEAQDLLARRDRDIPVYEGWPMQALQVPGLGVVLRPESEDANRQPIGDLGSYVTGGQETVVWESFFRATVAVSCYHTSQRGAIVLALVTKWALLQMRQLLENEDGLKEQVVSMVDIQPVESDVPGIDRLYMRQVVLQATYEDSWSEGYAPLIAAVQGTVTDERTVFTW